MGNHPSRTRANNGDCEGLTCPHVWNRFLFSLQVRNEDGATNSLPAIVRRGQQLAAADLAVAERLEDLLLKAGYSASHEAEYEKLRLRIVEEGLYRVSGDFPRLVRTSFPEGVPDGVDGIEYDIRTLRFRAPACCKPCDGPVSRMRPARRAR